MWRFVVFGGWGGDHYSNSKPLLFRYGNEVLPQDTTHLIQRPCYQRGSPCQDAAGDWTTWRSPDDRKETQTAVVWSCLPFNRSGQKTILQGTVKGGRRQGGQRKRWEANIREWTGLEFGKSQRAVENREKWRKLVAKVSVVPQRPSRLRHWWWWWWCFAMTSLLKTKIKLISGELAIQDPSFNGSRVGLDVCFQIPVRYHAKNVSLITSATIN